MPNLNWPLYAAHEVAPICRSVTTVFNFVAGHRVRLRTTNGLERINRKIKRRTRVASIT